MNIISTIQTKVSGRRPFLRWIFLAGIFISILISIFVSRWAQTAALEQLHTQAADDLKVNIAYIQSQIDNLNTLTRVVCTDARVLALMERPDDYQRISAVNHFLSRFNVTAGTLAYILNPNGMVMASGNWAAPDSFVGHNYGFRPYFKAALLGELGQHAAVGVTSGTLGYYVSCPIRLDGRIVAVAVTKTDPQDLVLAHDRTNRPFFITDPNGVVIIGNPTELLFHSLSPLSKSAIERLRHQHVYTGVDIKPLSTRSIDTIGNVRMMNLTTYPSPKMDRGQKLFVLASTTVPAAGWTAHILWPVHNLSARIIQSLMVTFLALVVTLLVALIALERWRHMKQMHQQAIRDPLTGLYTRLYMLESATLLLAAHDRNTIPGVGAIMFDLDHFKRINDRYGHSAGDNVLVKVSAILMKECRESDIPIRYGGEELLVFMPSGDERQILQLAERIRVQVKNLVISLAGHPIHITISGGIATHLPGEPLEKLVDRADRMLYKAKEKGRDQIFYIPVTEAS